MPSNKSFNTDTQRQEAASRLSLRAVISNVSPQVLA
jgi:hypothetical protein